MLIVPKLCVSCLKDSHIHVDVKLDLMPRFAKLVPQLHMVSNHVMNLIYTQWNHLLTDLDQPWLSPANLQQVAKVIHRKGGALRNFCSFVDGTVRPVSRPGRNQRVLYSGHKKVHSIKLVSCGPKRACCRSVRPSRILCDLIYKLLLRVQM